MTTKKETNEVTKKEDNNHENGIECLFRGTFLFITTIASATFKVSYHDQRPFVTAICACTHTYPGPNMKTTIQQEEEDDDGQ